MARVIPFECKFNTKWREIGPMARLLLPVPFVVRFFDVLQSRRGILSLIQEPDYLECCTRTQVKENLASI